VATPTGGCKFELPNHQVLITDEAAKAKAAAGADIHCPYCGTRNPAGTKTCSHCGGDLTEGKRESARY
jgi:DNA-directed RNA polymerase subunit RPC12/RpoP